MIEVKLPKGTPTKPIKWYIKKSTKDNSVVRGTYSFSYETHSYMLYMESGGKSSEIELESLLDRHIQAGAKSLIEDEIKHLRKEILDNGEKLEVTTI